MKRFLLIGLALILYAVVPAAAHEFFQGGWICRPDVPYSACNVVREREASGQVRIDMWARSAYTIIVASPKACIVRGSDTQFLFHAIVVGNGRGAIPSAWNGISHNNAEYAFWMNRSPWGRNIYKYVNGRGWLDTPELHALTGEQLISLGVPVCGNVSAK
jgi:hypothetical protein